MSARRSNCKILANTVFTLPLKPSQSGTVLKIALCWPLTGSVYTAMIKAVRVVNF